MLELLSRLLCEIYMRCKMRVGHKNRKIRWSFSGPFFPQKSLSGIWVIDRNRESGGVYGKEKLPLLPYCSFWVCWCLALSWCKDVLVYAFEAWSLGQNIDYWSTTFLTFEELLRGRATRWMRKQLIMVSTFSLDGIETRPKIRTRDKHKIPSTSNTMNNRFC